MSGSANYFLEYPDSSYDGRATLNAISFIDSTGDEFFGIGKPLGSYCQEAASSWYCSMAAFHGRRAIRPDGVIWSEILIQWKR